MKLLEKEEKIVFGKRFVPDKLMNIPLSPLDMIGIVYAQKRLRIKEVVLKNPSYVKLLSSAGILDVIRITSKLNIRREKRIDVWRAIFARWSTFSHTMTTAWGEFTFTLEDVCVLLELPCIGKDDFHSIKLSEEEMCLWERFGTCAPVPNAYPFASFFMNNPLSRNNYRAWAWHDRLPRGNVLEVMDVTKEFNPRPYVQPINGFGDLEIYYDRHPLQSGRMSSQAFDRVGIHTSRWFAYWMECIEEWGSFIMPLTNPRACLYTLSISNPNVSLRLISLKKKRNVNEEEDDAPCALTHQTKHVHRNAIRDEVVLDTETILAVEVVLESTPNVEVIHDVGVDTDDVRAIPMTPHASSSPVPKHRDASSASGTQVAHTEQSGKKVDFHGFQVSLEALAIAHAPLMSTSLEELQQMLQDFDDACNFGFKLECLSDCRSKAKIFLNKSSLKNELEDIAVKIALLKKREAEVQK
ncbi:Uncharacterized protein TCM_030125 [Theobroma cacao]|uniref:Aminotransferase-like plant mobile domain-containing protein n=1 Tax=Theobroma cacao TaxID=3641 RepID=A0A061GGM3_THECC|nr:Uncharacterized protein TCM_030125 [Theobroma cacao]